VTDSRLRNYIQALIYLAGPINGCTDEECSDWRKMFKQQFPNALDPMVRDYRGKEDECYREIVDLDKRDIHDCDAVVVNYVKPSVGTSMEVFLAWSIGKPVCVVARDDAKISPWLRYHSTTIVHSFDEAYEWLKRIL
jgi:nucleoside 2-deoxyribosyltransferase